jgi:hypothetical protein
LHGIARSGEHDRQRRRGLLRGQGGEGAADGHDDIDLERDQLGRQSGELLGLPLGIPVFDQEVAAFDVTEVTQSLMEGLAHVEVSGCQVERQVAYSSDLGRLLGLGGERRGEEAARQGADECASIHRGLRLAD